MRLNLQATGPSGSVIDVRYRGVVIVAQPLETGSFEKPDDVREGANWRLELVNLAGGAQVGRLTLQPGWRWSTDVKPVAGTEMEAGPGDVISLPPGHDAWGVGDETVVVVDWQGASVWAAPR
ncbi:cupin domain-containing protein [Homoserinimonas sp. A520]